ncbi:MAG: SUMF1/EgtB/PvdO family nonheme iron enzyme [Alphaproteobacteria bacterium]|nr:SUMF1/EgtB/PvdO family nonheme iron enzyme [Alphaproteobacteria bacterium]
MPLNDLIEEIERLGARLSLPAEDRDGLVALLRQAVAEGVRAALSGATLESLSLGSLLSNGSQDSGVGADTMWLDDEAERVDEAHVELEVLLEEQRRLGRYIDLGVLGRGAVGDVHRVLDRTLHRRMALKVLRQESQQRRDMVTRFIEEAQITAQLDHPGIVPVHELGRLEDGRCYFTMKEINGQTLNAVISELHQGATDGEWPRDPRGWTLRRVIDAFLRAVEAVAYAHSRGVVHRDLKPSNILVGSYGEVQVVDWGLARLLHRHRVRAEDDAVSTARSHQGVYSTRMGRVAGTPAYMSPEQARGENDVVGPASDVYALGAVLYRILVGRAPYAGKDSMTILSRVAKGQLLPLEGPLPIPGPLREICQRCLAFEPVARYPDAAALAQDLKAWLEGTRDREAALASLRGLSQRLQQAEDTRAQAVRVAEEAATLCSTVRPYDPIDRKQESWAREDEAAALAREAQALEVEVVESLRSLLTRVPDLPEAHALLADYYRARHADAVEARDASEALRAEQLLRSYHQGRYTRYLDGDGVLSLHTVPDGAEVELHRYVVQDRRLVPERVGPLGTTPLIDLALPAGSYLLVLRAPGHQPLRCPVWIERERHWQLVRPGDRDPSPLHLPAEGALGPDEILVPQGWFLSGGDPQAFRSTPRLRAWVDDVVVQRFMVTNAEYRVFLNDLLDQGRDDEAVTCAPREHTGALFNEGGDIAWTRGPDGRFELPQPLDPAWPVTMVSWHCARAYADWLAARTGKPWRLPAELEWEKAARGVDGRFLSFGDYLDPTFCATPWSWPGARRPARVDEFPLDASPYGILGATGNVRCWCLDAFQEAGPALEDRRCVLDPGPEDAPLDHMRVVRGGSWFNERGGGRLAGRYPCRGVERILYVGIRLARSWAP